MASLVSVLVFLPCLLYPFIVYSYHRMLRYKRREIDNILSQPGVSETFLKTETSKTLSVSGNTSLSQVIEGLFDVNYNWHSYLFPVACNMIVVAFAIEVGLLRIGIHSSYFGAFAASVQQLPVAFFAGVAGGFIWGAYDLIRKYGDLDLYPAALHLLWLRILIAGILSSLLKYLTAEGITPLVAFAIGAFPVDTLVDFVKGVAKDKIHLSSAASVAEQPNFKSIQGVSEKTVEQLRGEGIETTQQLANAEPIKLLLRTNLEWASILDLIDQAMLHIYVGDTGITSLRPMGIRGAMEFSSIYSELQDPKTQTSGQQMKAEAAKKLAQSEPAIQSLAETLWLDPKVQYIRNLLFGKPDSLPWSQGNPPAIVRS